jgi:hypothetical protein
MKEYIKNITVGELAEATFHAVCIMCVFCAALVIVKYALIGVISTTQ